METQYLMEPTILQNIPRETQTYVLQDLVNLKDKLNDRIMGIERHLTKYDSAFTCDEYSAKILELQILQWNMINVKDVISIANKPINSLIYAKGEAEKRRIIYNGILKKYAFEKGKKLPKGDQVTVKHIKALLAETRVEISQYVKRIGIYNLECTTKIEILKIG